MRVRIARYSACAVASGVAVEFIACRPARPVRGHLATSQEPRLGNRVDIPPGGAGGVDREQASLTQQPAAGSGQGVSVMMRS